MISYQMKNGTDQLLIRLRMELIERLEAAARKSVRAVTRNQIAAEIIEQYIGFWEQKEGAADAAYYIQQGMAGVPHHDQPAGAEDTIEVPVLRPYKKKQPQKNTRRA